MSQKASPDLLTAGVDELRDLQVDPTQVALHSAEFFSSMDAAPKPVTRQRFGLLFAMTAAAATAALITWYVFAPSTKATSAVHREKPGHNLAPASLPAEPAIVEAGSRVAMIFDPGSRYRFESVVEGQTAIRLYSGTASVRLFHDAPKPHSLTVNADDLSFVATGTIYTVEMATDGQPKLFVHQGQVSVLNARGEVIAQRQTGHAWPDDYQLTSDADQAAKMLTAHTIHLATSPRPAPAPAIPGKQAVAPPKRASKTAVSVAPTSEAAPPSASQKWQHARLLRAQYHYPEALEILKELAASDDRVWAPLALIEQVRIYHEHPTGLALSESDLISLARNFYKRFPSHELSEELAAMVCPTANKRKATIAPGVCEPSSDNP